MHLKQLKLAGFKSFVDPTVVHFPSQLVAVIGPNGCGKSNIIDAVRWVMGESSAKNLRGESMVDVIFNGASNRKPVGQASVELIFDNNSGRLIGPFASYGEIAVKRVVTRDGDSSYYLNGSRCRRRDITDIFLGTGAGARSYSIIGQGTISRLIEAKPEELRAFFEEAAGVSKYKERRRETLQRIAHTRENLTRVADIREELDKQLHRLERQAKSAERYTQLKEEEKLCKAQIIALKWQEYTQQQMLKQKALHELAVNYEQQQSLLTASNKERTELNEQLHDANDNAQSIQESFYQSGTEIARLEETRQQQEREKIRLEQDRQQMQGDLESVAKQLEQDKEELVLSQQHANQIEAKVDSLRIDFKESELLFQNSKGKQIQRDERCQEVQRVYNEVTREFQVMQVNLDHLEQRRQQTVLRLEKLNVEQTADVLEELEHVRKSLNKQQVKLSETRSFDEIQLKQATEETNVLRTNVQEKEELVRQLQDEFHYINSEYAALVAAQQAARKINKKNDGGISEWSDKSRLLDILLVAPEWQAVCERVLTDALHAYVLEDFEELWPYLSDCEAQGESILIMREQLDSPHSYPKLSDKIQGTIPATLPNLEHVFTAKHLEEAKTWLPQLAAHESIVTADGFWLGKGWIKLAIPEDQEEEGLLTRQQKIVDLAHTVKVLLQKIEKAKALRDDYNSKLQKGLDDVDLQRLNLGSSNEAFRINMNALSANEQSIEHNKKQMASLSAECEDLHHLLEELAEQYLELSEKLILLESTSKDYEQQHTQLVNEKERWIEVIESQNQKVEELRKEVHQAEIELDREVTKSKQLHERIDREQERFKTYQERLEHLALQCLQSSTPGKELQEQLAEQIMKHSDAELQLTLSRERLSQIRLDLEKMEELIFNYDLQARKLQELLAQTRMEEQELSVRASALHESLSEFELEAPFLLEQIPEGMTKSIREDELITLSEKIKRLGPINLAAIEEFATEQQRKTYLDEQYDDLNQALVTLETAIEKMDKETQIRLETTFNEVNTSFKALFPRLFGGGRAQLELTCDNLLEAGIVVMAQPPGKRNSTIHLLSGGEKAMTAVALVFAIFQLNPSPFCMLDEVDAPLDDVNVGRFCDLVKEMSQFVQFLFITHNKVTMELADHLIGVTMREPGVSRLVAVDVKQALTME